MVHLYHLDQNAEQYSNNILKNLFVTQLAKKGSARLSTPKRSGRTARPFTRSRLLDYISSNMKDEKYQLFHKSTEFNMKLVSEQHSKWLNQLASNRRNHLRRAHPI
jgi:hypothetical protein